MTDSTFDARRRSVSASTDVQRSPMQKIWETIVVDESFEQYTTSHERQQHHSSQHNNTNTRSSSVSSSTSSSASRWDTIRRSLKESEQSLEVAIQIQIAAEGNRRSSGRKSKSSKSGWEEAKQRQEGEGEEREQQQRHAIPSFMRPLLAATTPGEGRQEQNDVSALGSDLLLHKKKKEKENSRFAALEAFCDEIASIEEIA